MLLHFRNRMFWSFISPIFIVFLTFYGNQRSLFRNTGITWLHCTWNTFVLCKPMNKLVFMPLHFRNRMFWSIISIILNGFLTFYGNQRSLLRNSGITWLQFTWNTFALMYIDEQIGFHAFALSKSNVLELYFANFDWVFNVLRQSTITIPELRNHVTSLYLEHVCTNVNRRINRFLFFCTFEIECSGALFRQFWLVF